MKGIVIKSTGSWYSILEPETSRIFRARILGRFKLVKTGLTNPLAVGDHLNFEAEDDQTAWITAIHPRKNYLIRKAVNLSREYQILASNIDLACFLFTWKSPDTSLGFLDRFLVCCEAYDIIPLILFNKMDLLDEQELSSCQKVENIYQKIGYEVLEISSYSGLNIETLKSKMKNKVSLFFGHSAVGKSTLINKLDSNLNLRTGEISGVRMKGKHTTTFAQMHFLSFGASVIDIPGIREFGMVQIEKSEIQNYFPEILHRKKDCKFANCLHINEPQCSVLQDMKNLDIEHSRYASYLKLVDEACG